MALYCLIKSRSEEIVKSSKHSKYTYFCWIFGFDGESQRWTVSQSWLPRKFNQKNCHIFHTHNGMVSTDGNALPTLKITPNVPMRWWSSLPKERRRRKCLVSVHLRNVRPMTNYFMFCISLEIFQRRYLMIERFLNSFLDDGFP